MGLLYIVALAVGVLLLLMIGAIAGLLNEHPWMLTAGAGLAFVWAIVKLLEDWLRERVEEAERRRRRR